MSTNRTELLDDWRLVLQRVRSEAPVFPSIQFEEGSDEEGLKTDTHLIERAKCLWALQFDRSEDDDVLVRSAFEAETSWRRVAPFQGMGDELNLAAFLLAARPPEDAVAPMWEAKRSNFDTWCGFDSRFLGAAGVDEAIRRAREQDPVDQDLVERLLELTDVEVAQYLEEMAEWFPASPEAEVPFTWFDRARRSGDWFRAKVELDHWCESDDRPLDPGLSRFLASIDCYSEAVEVQRRVLGSAGGEKKSPLDGIRLAELQRLAGMGAEALQQLQRVQMAVRPAMDKNGHKRRCLAEEGFRLSIANNGSLALQAFQFSDSIAKNRGVAPQTVRIAGAKPTNEWLPLAVLELAHQAGDRCGKSRRAASYRRRADVERRRIAK